MRQLTEGGGGTREHLNLVLFPSLYVFLLLNDFVCVCDRCQGSFFIEGYYCLLMRPGKPRGKKKNNLVYRRVCFSVGKPARVTARSRTAV